MDRSLISLRSFAAALSDCSRVLIIRYSFRDKHVNHYLGEWFRDNQESLMVVVSPGEVPVDPASTLSATN